MPSLEELQKQVENLTLLIQDLISKVSFIPAKKYFVIDWLFEWCEVYKKPKLKEKSLNNLLGAIRLHIQPYVESINICEFTSIEGNKIINNVKGSRIAVDVFDILNESLREAKLNKLVKDNPMEYVKRPRHKRKIGKALTIEEELNLKRITKNHKLAALFRFYLLTAARPEEPYLIKWSDVDFEKKTLRIAGTKTDMSNRVIPLFKELEVLLKNIPHVDSYIFPMSYNSAYCTLKRLKEKHNLWYSLRSLRHTCATRWYERGVKLKTIAKWLGHSDTKMADQVYTEILEGYELEEAKLVNFSYNKKNDL